ncbi:MAG TPA: histidine--tRNA ligase [Candidatus Acidoferrales bacterium]|nr:histidine--tRNA ligase [Candidatus Acidoferrales bacterium]
MGEAAKPENERRKFRAIKGTRDILPPATDLWNWFEKTARGVMESYNFAEIRTPIFEETSLFARAVGFATDVVSKEMYTFEMFELRELEYLGHLRSEIWSAEQRYKADDPGEVVTSLSRFLALANQALDEGKLARTPENQTALKELREQLNFFAQEARVSGDELLSWHWEDTGLALAEVDLGDSLTLRPEATASVVRAYIEHGMQMLPGDAKLYYIGPMFRRERPQKGRYRQFYQIGAEVLGTSDAPAIDAELIQMLTDLLERCQIEKYTLLINSIGCAECRPKYVDLLRAELLKPDIFSKLGADSQRRVETNPLRVMDSKLPEEQAIIEKLPKISEHLCEECRTHYEKLKRELTLREVPFTESPRLVRGLDYYMRTTFEITSPILGAQNALCGGGRYDGLVEMLGGPKGIKGIGFALGEDRFIDAIEEARKVRATRPLDIFIAWMGEGAYPTAVRLAHVLRVEKHRVELPAGEMKFRKALERADKLGARYVLIIGDDEIASDMLTIKRLADGVQEKISEEALVDFFRPPVLTKEGPGS